MNRDLFAKDGINSASQIAKRYGATGCIVLLIDNDGYFSGASWGKNKSWCKRLGDQLDYLIDEGIKRWEAREGIVRLKYLVNEED